MTTFAEWIRSQPGRCPICGFDIEHQGCACDGTLRFAVAAKAEGIARVSAAADPGDRARIDAAIREVAARGGEFSSNDVRPLLGGLTGPLVGARFNAMARAGVIVHVGYERSTKASTHAHPVSRWVAA